MKANERKSDLLATALAVGGTVQSAAKHAKMSEAAAYRRQKDPALQARVREIRGELVTRAIGKLSAAMTKATDTLYKLLDAKSENVQLGASRSIIELGAKLKDVEIEQRVADLERRLTESERSRMPFGPQRAPGTNRRMG
jgi:hypothetical protein